MVSATIPPLPPSAPWIKETICWNNQPSFPTDPTLIKTISFRPGLSGASARTGQGVDNEIIFDLTTQALPIYWLAFTILRDQNVSDFVQITGVQIFSLQGNTGSVQVTNRQCDGSSNITLTTATPHNLVPQCWIRVSGVGTNYDVSNWTLTDTGTAGTTIKYFHFNPTTENIACTGSVIFQATGL